MGTGYAKRQPTDGAQYAGRPWIRKGFGDGDPPPYGGRAGPGRDGIDPVAEGKSATWVAYECGFADQSHLSRRFKECHGLTPGSFQAQFAAGRMPLAAVEMNAA